MALGPQWPQEEAAAPTAKEMPTGLRFSMHVQSQLTWGLWRWHRQPEGLTYTGPKVEFSLLSLLLYQNLAHPTWASSVKAATFCLALLSIRTLILGTTWSRKLFKWVP